MATYGFVPYLCHHYDYGKPQLRKLPDTGETRQEPQVAHRAFLAVAHRLLPRLEEIFRLARRRTTGGVAAEIWPEIANR